MTFTYMLTIDDMVAYNLHIYGRTLARRTQAATVIVSMAIGAFVWLVLRFEPPPVPYIAAAVAAGFFFVLLTVVRARAMAQNVRRMFGAKPDPTTFGSHRVTLDRDGVRIELEHIDARYDWEIVGDVVETPMHLFVHLGPVRAIVIPLNETLTGAHREEIAHAFRTYRRSQEDDRSDSPAR